MREALTLKNYLAFLGECITQPIYIRVLLKNPAFLSSCNDFKHLHENFCLAFCLVAMISITYVSSILSKMWPLSKTANNSSPSMHSPKNHQIFLSDHLTTLSRALSQKPSKILFLC